MKYIVANFKMNGSINFIQDYFQQLSKTSHHHRVICPPFPYLQQIATILKSESLQNCHLGAQNCASQKEGAYTGEVSARMLKEFGCQYVILGHSERRQLQGERSPTIKEKAQLAIEEGLIPIICVGETGENRNNNETETTILNQLQESTPEMGDYMIAYEPIWAIGTGNTATPNDILSVHSLIRKQSVYKNIPLLYGGSVNAKNCETILEIPNVDGVLVGGASLDPEQMNLMS